ncbi:MAG: LuxR family transcriptional regulator [Prevotella sp.]|nr:LuxR family transcriptional regulator [Prevotella sp.]
MKFAKICLICLISILFSCNGNQTEDIISDTDTLLVNNPKRAIAILDSLEQVSSLNEKERMHLVWNRALAHQTLGQSLAEDDQLMEAINYYRTENDKQADSYLLEASYFNWKGKEEDAIRAIDKGLTEISDSIKRVQLLVAKVGMLEHQRKYDQASGVLKEALTYDMSKRESAILNYKLGLNLSLLGDKHSEYYYDKGIKLATENGDTDIACEIMRNYADYLANNGQYSRSNAMFYQIGKLMPQAAELSAIQMSMAGNYINMHRLDSARICNDKAIKSETELEAKGFANIARRAELEQKRFLLDYESGKPVSSVEFARFLDSITADMQAKESTLARRQETKNRLQAANYELKLSKQRMGWLLSVTMLLLIGGGMGGYLYYRNRIRQLAEAEDRIDTLTKMLTEAQKAPAENEIGKSQPQVEDDAFFKKILLQQLGIIRLVASTPTNQNQALLKRISGISGGEIPTDSLLVWSDLYPVINRLYDNFHTRLTNQYAGALTEKEVQICCLLCAGFSTKEIGVITQQSNATIYVRKTAIRKKIGAAEGQDIVACINSVKG